MRALRGRLVFAEAQIFGRLASVHMKRLSRLESLVGEVAIDQELGESLMFLKDRVITGGPRRVLASVGRVFIYTQMHVSRNLWVVSEACCMTGMVSCYPSFQSSFLLV